MKTGIICILLADFVCGWDILTATLDPPTNPILEGETVTAKVRPVDVRKVEKIFSILPDHMESRITFVH